MGWREVKKKKKSNNSGTVGIIYRNCWHKLHSDNSVLGEGSDMRIEMSRSVG